MVPQEDLPKLFAWASENRLALFPIPKFCKRPTGIVGSHARDWSMDPGKWRQWWEQNDGCNFGVACGPSRIIVVDVDIQSPNHAFYATVATPSGGLHAYHRVPGGIDASTLRQPDLERGVNTRAGNGYVVSPWSVTDPSHDSGVKALGPYRLVAGTIPEASPSLIAHCAPGPPAAAIQSAGVELADDGLPLSAADRVRVWTRTTEIFVKLRGAVPGERNNRLNEAAFAIGKMVAAGDLDEAVAQGWLEAEATSIGLTLDEIRATTRSGMRAAPRVGRPEPKSAMAELLAWEIPVAPFARPAPRLPRTTSLVPPEPLVERLLYAGEITLLSGGSGSGKTTLAASLAAASTTDVRDFRFGDFADGFSDVLIRPCAWVFLSYEGGQHVARNTAAWHKGSGVAAAHPARFLPVVVDDGPLVADHKREATAREQQVTQINDAIAAAERDCPGLPVVLAVDNATAAIENSMDNVQSALFMRCMRAIANRGVAVLLLGHPPKGGSSAVFGSHVLFSLSDTVGSLEVVRRDDGEWTQWVDFPKHRVSPNGKCLEIKSRRLAEPLAALPAEWGAGNERARERQIRDLHVPYVRTIRVRNASERSSASSGVVEHVTAKEAGSVRV